MSARVYLTSGRWVDVPGESVGDIVSELTESADHEWYLVGAEPAAAFRVGAVEAVVAI